MAKITSNINMTRMTTQRDKALQNIKFNDSYLSIAKDELKEKSDRKLYKRELNTKRSLLALEKKSMSENKSLEYDYQKALKKLYEKQHLPRLAVEQKYKRMQEAGSEKAEYYKKNALAKLDDAIKELKDKWTKRVNEADTKVDESVAVAYKEKSETVKVKLDKLRESLEKKNQEKIERLNKKTAKENAKLKDRAEKYNTKIDQLNTDTESAMKEKDTVLEVEELLMLFDGLRAVDGLSFKVKEGEIFGLIGPNGAGKTTVFNCITQFNKPSGGRIHYRSASGEVIDVTKKKVHDIVKIGIVRTFQNLELIWELSVLDNMLIGAHSLYNANLFDHIIRTRKLKREEKIMKNRALDVLERLNLLVYKDMIPYGLPYGILKRIELARTLMVNPRLIILDEPAAGLNEAETEELAETICKIKEDYGCTIFLVEHDMGLVMDICDTVCAISFGKLLAVGKPGDIQENELVQEAYLGGTMTEDDDE